MAAQPLFAVHPTTGQRLAVGREVLRRAIEAGQNSTGLDKRKAVAKMGRKSEYVMALVAEDIPFPEAVVVALQAFKRNHKTNSPLPFEQATAARFAAMQALANVICAAYERDPVTLRMRNISPGGESAASHYNSEEEYVLLTGKLSVITFLHEMAHVLQYDEEQARKWSLTLFKKVYPIAFEKLNSVGGVGSFYLVRDRPTPVMGALPAVGEAPVGVPSDPIQDDDD